MECKGGLDLLRAHWHDDGVPRIVTASTASADIRLGSKNVHKLALPLVPPLRAEDDRDRP